MTARRHAPRRRVTPDWRWRTFPVFCAFVAGLLLASVLNGEPDNALGAVVQLVALLAVAYALIHLFVMNVVVAGRAKRRDAAAARGEAPDDEWEDEVVYPEERT
jgi:hypothetical protein